MVARGNMLIGSLKYMTPDQKAHYLPRMARGEFLGAFCCRSQMPDRMWPTSPAAPNASATNGRLPATNIGAPSPMGQISSSSSRAPTRPSIRKRAIAAFLHSCWRSRADSCRKAARANRSRRSVTTAGPRGNSLRPVPRAGREPDRRGGQSVLSGDCWPRDGAGAHGRALHWPRAGWP